MNNKDYLAWALTKDRSIGDYREMLLRMDENPELQKLFHGAMGLAGETGELVDSVKKSIMYGKPVDAKHLKEEAGDVLWYMAILLDTIGSSFDEVMEINRAKLEARFPGGFTESLAKERLDKK